MTLQQPIPPKGDVELYEEAVKSHEEAYFAEHKTKTKYRTAIGHMLQGLFGRPVWALKDLNNGQLKAIIALAEKKIRNKEK